MVHMIRWHVLAMVACLFATASQAAPNKKLTPYGFELFAVGRPAPELVIRQIEWLDNQTLLVRQTDADESSGLKGEAITRLYALDLLSLDATPLLYAKLPITLCADPSTRRVVLNYYQRYFVKVKDKPNPLADKFNELGPQNALVKRGSLDPSKIELYEYESRPRFFLNPFGCDAVPMAEYLATQKKGDTLLQSNDRAGRILRDAKQIVFFQEARSTQAKIFFAQSGGPMPVTTMPGPIAVPHVDSQPDFYERDNEYFFHAPVNADAKVYVAERNQWVPAQDYWRETDCLAVYWYRPPDKATRHCIKFKSNLDVIAPVKDGYILAPLFDRAIHKSEAPEIVYYSTLDSSFKPVTFGAVSRLEGIKPSPDGCKAAINVVSAEEGKDVALKTHIVIVDVCRARSRP